MQYRRSTEFSFSPIHQRAFVSCAQCGETIIAPVWSEHVNERYVRHLWCCDRCDYKYETAVHLPLRTDSADPNIHS